MCTDTDHILPSCFQTDAKYTGNLRLTVCLFFFLFFFLQTYIQEFLSDELNSISPFLKCTKWLCSIGKCSGLWDFLTFKKCHSSLLSSSLTLSFPHHPLPPPATLLSSVPSQCSFRELMRAQILSAGPSLTFMALIR